MVLKKRYPAFQSILCLLILCSVVFAKNNGNTRYGFDAISLNGAGRSLDLENSTTSGNPASLGTEHTDGYEMGISGIGVEPNLYSSWIRSISKNSAISTSYTVDPLLDFEVQSLALGVSLMPLRKISIGFLGLGRRNETENFSMDFSAGALYRFNQMLNFAIDTRSLFETLDSTGSSPNTERTFGASTSLTFRDIRTFVVLDAEGTTLKQSSQKYSLGLGTVAGTHNNLKVQGGITLQTIRDTYTSTLALGMKMQEKFFGMLINAHYAIQDLTLTGTNINAFSHAIGFGVILDAFVDKTPPVSSVRLDKSIILLNPTDPKSNALHFQLRAKDDQNNLEVWHLVICSLDRDFAANEVVKSFSGKGIPPKTVKWEGRGNDNERLSKGFYSYRLIVSDVAGNVDKTTWQLLEVQ